MFLNKNAFFIHPFTNDTGGASDKFLSFSSSLGFVGSWGRLGFESRLHWRMITPSFQDRRDVTPLRKEPVGRYAEWSELQTGFSYTFPSGYGLSVNYGAGLAGGNNAKVIQHWWHERLGVKSNKRLTWDEQLVGRRDSYGAEVRIATIAKRPNILQLLSFGYQKNLLLEEAYTRSNIVWGYNTPSGSVCTFDFIFARPLGGELNDNYSKTRFESGLACRIFSVYSPGVRYVSPYIVGEKYPQIYYELFNVQIEI